MNILVIGKPTYNVILPLDNFVLESNDYNLIDKLEMGGGASFYAASLLSKWKMPIFYTGVIGSDPYGNKIKSDLEEFGVNTKYLEINYENPTTSNYIIINKSTGSATQIKRSNPEINLTKYKYEFIPDYIIMDGTDPSGSIAALNNFPNATSILLATKVSEELYSISKRCNYVVANTTFAKALTKMNLELNKNKLVVNFMQKIKDLNKARYIITLGDKGVLYVSDNQVKLLPATLVEKIEDDSNASPAFFGALCYGLINNYDIDKAVKIANITAGLALTTIGSIKSVPELSEVLNMAGLKEVIETEEHENEEESPSTNLPNIKEEEVPAIQVSS